jgi:hypothetical protein
VECGPVRGIGSWANSHSWAVCSRSRRLPSISPSSSVMCRSPSAGMFRHGRDLVLELRGRGCGTGLRRGVTLGADLVPLAHLRPRSSGHLFSCNRVAVAARRSASEAPGIGHRRVNPIRDHAALRTAVGQLVLAPGAVIPGALRSS